MWLCRENPQPRPGKTSCSENRRTVVEAVTDILKIPLMPKTAVGRKSVR
jgi:hypothetical protein